MIGLEQGEVWIAELPAPINRRPVLVLTRSAGLRMLHNVTVATISNRVRGGPSEVELSEADGVSRHCAVSLDNLITIPQHYLTLRITRLSPDRMNEIWEALHFAFDMPY